MKLQLVRFPGNLSKRLLHLIDVHLGHLACENSHSRGNKCYDELWKQSVSRRKPESNY